MARTIRDCVRLTLNDLTDELYTAEVRVVACLEREGSYKFTPPSEDLWIEKTTLVGVWELGGEQVELDDALRAELMAAINERLDDLDGSTFEELRDALLAKR